MCNVICLKWGTRYPVAFVNRLYRGVGTHLHRPFRFVCITDAADGLDDGVETFPIPPAPQGMVYNEEYPEWPNVLLKLFVFKPGFAQLRGPTLFLDIDQVIVGDLDCFFDYRPGTFCIIRNWIEFRKRIFRKVPFCGNSSVFRFEAGGPFDYVFEKFMSEIPVTTDLDRYPTEQLYMTLAVGRSRVNFWPDAFVRSFKRSCMWPWPLNHLLTPRLRPDTRILCFHGAPNPDQAIAGYRGRHLNTWSRPAPWIRELWGR